MKRLDRPNGYFQTWDPVSGRHVEGETRQCCHCGFMWVYDPVVSMARKIGMVAQKPVTRGVCIKCHGLVCAQPECLKKGCVPMLQQIEEIENANRSQSGILLG